MNRTVFADDLTPATAVSGRRTRVRYMVAAFMWLAIAINYMDRTVLSAAAPAMSKDLGIPPDMMGLVLSAFFWSYALLQIPAGWFADRFGHKTGLGLSVLLWSAATSATGLATGVVSLFGLRVALGVGEAGAYPSNAGIASKWFPDGERATVGGLFDSASKFGGAVAMPLIVWLIATVQWRLTFAIVGALGLAWSLAWWLLHTETPEAHPRINRAEVDHIRGGQRLRHGAEGGPALRWYQLLRHRNVWAMCLGFFCINYISYFFITWMPTYLVRQQGMGMLEMGFVAALPLLCGLVSEILAGYLSDRVVRSGRLSLTATRKLFLIAGLAMALSIGFAPFTHAVPVAVALLCVAKAGTAVAASQVWALPGDVAPRNMTATLAGLQNGVSNFGGAIGPIVTGAIVTATGSFNAALVFSAALGLLGILNYAFLLGPVAPIGAGAPTPAPARTSAP